MSWGHIIIVLMMVVGIAGGVYIYRTPGARERGNRTLQELRARYSNFKGTVCDYWKKDMDTKTAISENSTRKCILN